MGGSNLFQGTLDLLVLRTIRDGALHGYAIGRSIRDSSGGVLGIEEGALYPALHRLEERGLIKGQWGKTDRGRRARFYGLSARGRKHLADELERWAEHAEAVQAVIAGPTNA